MSLSLWQMRFSLRFTMILSILNNTFALVYTRFPFCFNQIYMSVQLVVFFFFFMRLRDVTLVFIDLHFKWISTILVLSLLLFVQTCNSARTLLGHFSFVALHQNKWMNVWGGDCNVPNGVTIQMHLTRDATQMRWPQIELCTFSTHTSPQKPMPSLTLSLSIFPKNCMQNTTHRPNHLSAPCRWVNFAWRLHLQPFYTQSTAFSCDIHVLSSLPEKHKHTKWKKTHFCLSFTLLFFLSINSNATI